MTTKTSEGVEGFAVATLEHEPSRTAIVISSDLAGKHVKDVPLRTEEYLD